MASSGLNELAVSLSLMSQRAEEDAKQVTEEHLAHVIDEMKSTVSVDTGATRDSIDGEVTVKGGVVTGTAGATTPQAVYLEYGGARSPIPFAGPALVSDEEHYVQGIADMTTRRWL